MPCIMIGQGLFVTMAFLVAVMYSSTMLDCGGGGQLAVGIGFGMGMCFSALPCVLGLGGL